MEACEQEYRDNQKVALVGNECAPREQLYLLDLNLYLAKINDDLGFSPPPDER